MSRLARNEYIEWLENQDHEELNEKFVKAHELEFFNWSWELFMDSLRGDE